MKTLKRYSQAFFRALKMTLEGNAIQPAQTRYPNLTKWVAEGKVLADKVMAIADSNGMDESARKALTLKIDRRNMSMDVIVRAVQHNMNMEYPMLLDAVIEGNLTTIYAINMNDQYRIGELAQADNLQAEVKQALDSLADHLNNIPPSNNP